MLKGFRAWFKGVSWKRFVKGRKKQRILLTRENDLRAGLDLLWRKVRSRNNSSATVDVVGGIIHACEVGFYVDPQSRKITFSFVDASFEIVELQFQRRVSTVNPIRPLSARLSGDWLDTLNLDQEICRRDLKMSFKLSPGGVILEMEVLAELSISPAKQESPAPKTSELQPLPA